MKSILIAVAMRDDVNINAKNTLLSASERF